MYLKKKIVPLYQQRNIKCVLVHKIKFFQFKAIFSRIPLKTTTTDIQWASSSYNHLVLPPDTGGLQQVSLASHRKGRDLLEASVPGCWGGIRPLTLPPTHTDAQPPPPCILSVPLQAFGSALWVCFCHFQTATGAASWSTCPRRSGSAPIKKVGSLLHVNTTGLQHHVIFFF